MGSVVTPEGPKRVDQVKAGDLVASQMPGQDLEFTEVTIADEYKGDFTFVNFEFADGTSLNTTSNHVVAVRRSFGPAVSVAADVREGDEMYIRPHEIPLSGSSRQLRATKVTAVKTFHHPQKYYVATKNAAMLVENVLTTTICDGGVETLPLGLVEAQAHWIKLHQAEISTGNVGTGPTRD